MRAPPSPLILSVLLLSLLAIQLPHFVEAFTLEVDAPSQIFEGQPLEVRMSTDTPQGETAYRIERDGDLLAEASEHTWQTGYNDAGQYLYTFEASYANESEQVIRAIKVVDEPLVVTIESPEETKSNHEEVLIDVATSRPAQQCNYTLGSQSGTLDGAGTAFERIVTVLEGMQTLVVRCKDAYESTHAERTFIIDRTPPTLEGFSPSINQQVSGDFLTLSLSTDEAATCRYSSTNEPYESLPSAFSITGELHHEVSLDHLVQGAHTIYVACSDLVGNPSSTVDRFFRVNRPPTASIEIDGDEPLRQGTYSVRLSASEDLREAPTLRYQFEDGSNSKEVALSGEDRDWEGYMIIDASANHRIGSFTFKGVDNTGLEGTQISEGKLFLIDTQQHGELISFSVRNSSSSIELRWVYDGDQPRRFNIYRSSSPDVGYLDLLTSIEARNQTSDGLLYMSFRDYDVQSAINYYYRIAAEDDAGNVGPLSDEREASAVIEQIKQQARDERLDAALRFQVEQEQTTIADRISDVESAIMLLESTSQAGAQEYINTLGILDDAKQAKAQLTQLDDRLEQAKGLSLSQEDIDELITDVRVQIDQIRAQVVEDVRITANGDYLQSINAEQLESAARELPATGQLEQAQLQQYLDAAAEMQRSIEVRAKVIAAELRYLDGRREPQSVVTKRISASEPFTDVIVVEQIPKQIAQSAEQIDFFEEPIVLRDDPVVQYSLSSLTTKEITYAFEGSVSATQMRATRTVVLPKPESVVANEPDNHLTGAVPAADGSERSWWADYIVLIVGVAIIAGLLLYLTLKPDERVGPQSSPSRRILPTAKPSPAKDAHGPNGLRAPSPQKARPRVLDQQSMGELRSRITEALRAADENRYEQARQAYTRLLAARYDALPLAMRANMRTQLEELYHKIKLSECIILGHELLRRKDRHGLAQIVAQMERIAERIGQADNPLCDEADASYDRFKEGLREVIER